MVFKRTLKWIVGCTAAVIVAAGVGIGTRALSRLDSDLRSSASTEVHKVLGNPYIWTDNPNTPVDTVYRGEVFYVHNQYIRPETCHVMVTNLWIDTKDKIAHHHSIFSNWFPQGTYELNEYFEVPAKLPIGKWNIIKKTVNFCNGQVYYTTNYNIEVTIADPIKASSARE